MLRERSRALATTVAIALVLAVAALIGHDGAGAAPAAAAPTVPEPKQQIVVFVPHADDDVLSMGVFIQQQVALGKDVRVVYYTDGAGTGVCGLVDGVCRSQDKFEGETEDQFIAHRDHELFTSVEGLGVPADHVERYEVDGVRPHDGLMTESVARTMLAHYHALYPAASFLTMSWLDAHTDHGSAGRALRALVDEHEFPTDQALFSMARWYWAYDYPSRSLGMLDRSEQLRANYGYPTATVMLSCDADATCRQAVEKAVSAYGPCAADSDPDQCSGIGYDSVKQYLDVTKGDPRIIIHGADAAKYPSQLSTVTATRDARTPVVARLAGTIRVPSFGRYGTDYTKAANAGWLVKSIHSSHVKNPFPAGAMATVTSLDTRRRPIRSVRVALTQQGKFVAAVAVPAASSAVRVTSDATQGTLPASLVLPVMRQQVTAVASAGVKVRHGVIRTSYGRRVVAGVKATANGRAVARAVATVRTADGLAVRQAKTGKSGSVRIALPISAVRSLVVTAATKNNTVPALPSAIRAKVAPAALTVRAPKAVHRHGRHVTVAGSVAGRDYRISKGFLTPVTIRLYRVAKTGKAGKAGKAVYAGAVRTARGGAFTATIPARKNETITFRVVGVPHVFATVTRAGTVKVA